MLKDEYKKYSRLISEAHEQKKPFKIENQNEFSNYLGDLELISLFVNKKNLDIDFAYEIFGIQILECWQNDEVKKFVKSEKDIYGQDLFSQIDKIIPKLKQIEDKKSI